MCLNNAIICHYNIKKIVAVVGLFLRFRKTTVLVLIWNYKSTIWAAEQQKHIIKLNNRTLGLHLYLYGTILFFVRNRNSLQSKESLELC